ncbi:hypothetical protein P153DRAFT_366200 [Dothidotthia symphoricarpi CBS 119687]|uniref:MYND-type domain-containing protein n=1 Tax=Dothidotthia symphoricarpi CBS 119687 TaxID=1392245 RepID=A0A6A6AF96_9PLEO|nr:uncharacterized protein P153DRAFT_366200 [Dothidotthia symphoricarpi CBS 119687]KAF2130642.1 hypothetical protein P153DRAFT_366200 [Dothidotthia symphoricarpi CBS 119687]
MAMKILPLDEFRLPDYPDARLHLDRSPLAIISDERLTSETDTSNLTIPIGIATVLYHWCPDALAAFLDLDAWFSFTWILTIQQGEPDETKIEIGRVGNQITFGTLDKNGDNWTLMVTYNISTTEPDRGAWIPNPKESMENDRDIVDPEEVESLGKGFARNLVLERGWATGKKLRHQFFVEYAPMDIFGDGIPMNPHWLYKSVSLVECTTCQVSQDTRALSRCGRCGTATYCSDTCQRNDWAVHKHICNMGIEDRGQALKITQNGGLIGWDTSKTMAEEGSEEESKNPNFAEQQLKRCAHE